MKDLANYQKFDDTRRKFIQCDWYGGWGLAPIATPEQKHALPERKPGRQIDTTLGRGTEVRRHNCEGNFWATEGVLLVDGIFYRPRFELN